MLFARVNTLSCVFDNSDDFTDLTAGEVVFWQLAIYHIFGLNDSHVALLLHEQN
jgi:uncharacterized membrane protein